MANALYSKGKNAFLSTELRWASACTFRVALVASTYSVDLVAHDFYNDITAAQIVASATLSTLSSSDGGADSADVTFSSVSGSTIHFIVLYHWTGTASTSDLVAYYDTFNGAPTTPNGQDIDLTVDSSSVGWFSF